MPWDLRRESSGPIKFCGMSSPYLDNHHKMLIVFQNASWEINSLKVYKKQWVAGSVSSAERLMLDIRAVVLFICTALLVGLIGSW